MTDRTAGGTRALVRSLLVAVATLAVLTTAVPVTATIRLTTSTLLVMGGSMNPAGLTPRMQQQLGGDPWYPAPNVNPLTPVGAFGRGYIDVGNPDSPYAGWDLSLVNWPAQISLPIFGMDSYGSSQRAGLASFDAAITATLPTLADDEQVTALGYSSSANVMVRAMRNLQQQGAPDADRLTFVLLGNPNRPNGGILQRFAGLHIPVLDVAFDGSTPLDTPYPTVDISWQYDLVADFPTYPLNLVAMLNSLIGGMLLHGNYYRADIDGPRAFPDSTVGNITYITLEPPHLPLLLPLYDLGFPAPVLDLIEPALTIVVDWGYDRTVAPGTPTTARLAPPAAVDPSSPPAALRPARSAVSSPGSTPPRRESVGRSRSAAAARAVARPTEPAGRAEPVGRERRAARPGR